MEVELTMPEPNHELNGKKDTITLSCRLDKTLYNLLQGDSKKKDISLNSLINSILKRYIAWERYAEEVGFIPLAKDTVRLIFDSLDDRRMRKIAEQLGKTIPRELILLMFNKIDFENVVSFVELTSSRYGMVQHSKRGGTHDLILYHGVNEKFSHFLTEVLKSMAADLAFRSELLDSDSNILHVRLEDDNSA